MSTRRKLTKCFSNDGVTTIPVYLSYYSSKLAISVTIEAIEFSISEKIYMGPMIALGYFSLLAIPQYRATICYGHSP